MKRKTLKSQWNVPLKTGQGGAAGGMVMGRATRTYTGAIWRACGATPPFQSPSPTSLKACGGFRVILALERLRHEDEVLSYGESGSVENYR